MSRDSEDQEMLREAVRKFAEERIGPHVSSMDEAEELQEGIVRELFEQGYMGVEIDPKYGGVGMSFTDCLIIVEEIARVDPSVAVMVDIHNTLINRAMTDYGTEEQKEHYLSRFSTDMVGAFCISEPQSGSDAFALRTRADALPDGSGYKLNGAKCWISNSKEAGFFLVFASVDLEKGYKGITAFLVDRDAPGLEIGKKERKLGIRASTTCPLYFSDVFVPANRVLGEVGQGYKIAIESLNEGRIGIAAQMLGLAKGAFDHSMRYIHDRQQFGQRISDFQGVKFQVAEAAMQIDAAHLMVYNAAALKEAGLPFIKEAAMSKLYASQVANSVSSQAVEWLGGVGFTREYPVEKFYRDAKIGAIYEGTSNIQRDTIAKIISKEYSK